MQQEKNKEENIFIYYYFAKWMEENFTRLVSNSAQKLPLVTSSFQDKWAFYPCVIIKDGPDLQATKKFERTVVPWR